MRGRGLGKGLWTASTALAATIALAVGPASAQQGAPIWQDADPENVLAGVTLNDVAVHGGGDQSIVVAVGHRRAGIRDEAVAFWRRNGAWSQAWSRPSTTESSSLVDVAITSKRIWAVGSAGEGPLAVRFAPSGIGTVQDVGSWGEEALGGAEPLLSVGLYDNWGFVGNATGEVYGIGSSKPLPSALPAGSVNGIVAFKESNGNPRGFAVTDFSFGATDEQLSDPGEPAGTGAPTKVGTTSRILEISYFPAGNPDYLALTEPQVAADTAQRDIASIAGLDSKNTIAIEGERRAGIVDLNGPSEADLDEPIDPTKELLSTRPSYWSSSDGTYWTRASSPSAFSDDDGREARLSDVAMGRAADGRPVTAIVGSMVKGANQPAAGDGAVWTRVGTGSWQRDDAVNGQLPSSLAAVLSGVAVVAADDIWAVGAAGTVLRYHTPPPTPVDPTPEPDPQPTPVDNGPAVTPTTTPTTTTTSAGSGSKKKAASNTDVDVEQPKSGKQGGSKKGADAPSTRRLMSGIRVRRKRGMLIINFRLTGKAKVGVVARRGGRVIGRRGIRTLRKGRRQLVVRYRGKRPPTQLKIIVRPAG